MTTRKGRWLDAAVIIYVCLFIARVIDNDILGAWETNHISQGLIGSWVWVAIKFGYWCAPVLIYLALRGRLSKYLGATFGWRLRWSLALLILPLWMLALLLSDRFVAPTLDLTYFHLVTSVVATPLIEEFVFRGFLLDAINNLLT